jgi:cytidylate kinase
MKNSTLNRLPVKQTELPAWSSYILSQLESDRKPSARVGRPGPAVTISHQTGSGAHEIAQQLADALQKAESNGSIPWTVFDRGLVEKALEEHKLPKALAKFMPEDRRSFIQDVMEELVGLRPPSWVMVPKIAETILHLADTGHVVLVGRGANFITARMPNVFHVRLIASLPKRIERVQTSHGLTWEEATAFVKNEDRSRSRYVKEHFHKVVDDDLSYHLILNTNQISWADAVQLICEGARRCFGWSGE